MTENLPENLPEEKITLPVIHNSCPACMSQRRLSAIVVDQLKKSGGLPKTLPFSGLALQVPLVDQTRPPILVGPVMTIKVMTVMLEICAEPDCGAMYCTSFNIVETPAQMQSMKR